MNANPSTAAVANRRGTHLAAGSSWATSVTWVAILAPLPYSLSRLLWAAGVPFGISPEGLRELDSPGWGSLPILLLALLSEATAIFVHAFVLSRARTVPSWIPVLRGRPVRPRLVTAGLLMPIAILAYANAITAAMMLGLVNTAESQLYGDEWGVGMTGALFWMWGPALTAATLIYYRRTRRRAQPRSAADADSVAASGTRDRTGLVGSLPQRSLGLGCVRRVRLGGRLCSRRPWLSGRGRHGRPGWPLRRPPAMRQASLIAGVGILLGALALVRPWGLRPPRWLIVIPALTGSAWAAAHALSAYLTKTAAPAQRH